MAVIPADEAMDGLSTGMEQHKASSRNLESLAESLLRLDREDWQALRRQNRYVPESSSFLVTDIGAILELRAGKFYAKMPAN